MTTAGSAHQDGWPDADSHVRLPDATRVFEVRAARFRALEVGHAAGPYLRLLGALADSQARSCQDMPTSLDSAELLSPLPLDARAWRRADAWRRALDGILEQLAGVAPPRDTAASLARLAGMGTEQRERTAGAVLAQASHEDEASAVFVASALQVYWTSLAELVPADRLTPDQMTGCPVCGSPPVAGLVAASHTLRHLACSLCATRWHRTRLTCVHCGSTSDLAYFAIEGGPSGVKAEACARCRRYLKLFYLEQVPGAEPVADDVATVALDLLMADEGFARAGANPFLLRAAPR